MEIVLLSYLGKVDQVKEEVVVENYIYIDSLPEFTKLYVYVCVVCDSDCDGHMRKFKGRMINRLEQMLFLS